MMLSSVALGTAPPVGGRSCIVVQMLAVLWPLGRNVFTSRTMSRSSGIIILVGYSCSYHCLCKRLCITNDITALYTLYFVIFCMVGALQCPAAVAKLPRLPTVHSVLTRPIRAQFEPAEQRRISHKNVVGHALLRFHDHV